MICQCKFCSSCINKTFAGNFECLDCKYIKHKAEKDAANLRAMNGCSVCGNKTYCKGLCKYHYNAPFRNREKALAAQRRWRLKNKYKKMGEIANGNASTEGMPA